MEGPVKYSEVLGTAALRPFVHEKVANSRKDLFLFLAFFGGLVHSLCPGRRQPPGSVLVPLSKKVQRASKMKKLADERHFFEVVFMTE